MPFYPIIHLPRYEFALSDWGQLTRRSLDLGEQPWYRLSVSLAIPTSFSLLVALVMLTGLISPHEFFMNARIPKLYL